MGRTGGGSKCAPRRAEAEGAAPVDPAGVDAGLVFVPVDGCDGQAHIALGADDPVLAPNHVALDANHVALDANHVALDANHVALNANQAALRSDEGSLVRGEVAKKAYPPAPRVDHAAPERNEVALTANHAALNRGESASKASDPSLNANHAPPNRGDAASKAPRPSLEADDAAPIGNHPDAIAIHAVYFGRRTAAIDDRADAARVVVNLAAVDPNLGGIRARPRRD